jgi:hypothetical protein
VRRDEIKLFPGNVETHIRRLDQHSDPSATPIASEVREDPDDDPQLHYLSPRVRRNDFLAWLKRNIGCDEAFSTPTSLCVLMIATTFAVYGLWEKLEPWIWLTGFSVIVLSAPLVASLVQFARTRRRH